MPLTTELDIVNAALRKVGARAISAISDTTAAGAIAGDVLVSERDALLRNYTWNFAVARADLTPLASAPTFEFTSAFGLPSDWIRTISVHNKTDHTEFVRYKMETVSVSSVFTRCIATNNDDIYIVYVRSTSGDAGVAIMAAAFQECLILRMARIFASGLANSNSLLQLIDKEYQQALERAQLTDEIENYPDSMSSDFWGSGIINGALRRIRGRRGTDEEQMLPAGIVVVSVFNDEVESLLREHPWNFATARTQLPRYETVAEPLFGWQYAYALPQDFLRVVSVHDHSGGTGKIPYKIENFWTDTEHVTNGTFDADSGWTKGTGWTISGGKATHAAGTGSDLSQAQTLVSGAIYRVSYTISNRTAGTITPKYTGGSTVTFTAREDNTRWVVERTSTGNTALVFSASSDFDGSLDDISVVRVGDSGLATAILTDSSEVFLRYVRKVNDSSVMPREFRRVLELRMAKVFAVGMQNGATIVKLLDSEMRDALQKAKSVDGIEDMQDQRPEGSWIQARRGGWHRGNSVHGT